MTKPIKIIGQTPICSVCGNPSEVTLDYDKWLRWENGEMIQNVWPQMSADEREVLISGTHPKCWDELFEES